MKTTRKCVLTAALSLCLALTACGKDKKANETLDKMLEGMSSVKSYRAEAHMVLDGKSSQFDYDFDVPTGNIRLEQVSSDKKRIDLVRVGEKDYVSTDEGKSYQAVNKQDLSIVSYNNACGVLIPQLYTYDEESKTLKFKGFNKQIYESLKAAYNLSISGYTEEECQLEVTLIPDESGSHLAECIASVECKNEKNTNRIDIDAKFSEFNSIKPIEKPENIVEASPAESGSGEAGGETTAASDSDSNSSQTTDEGQPANDETQPTTAAGPTTSGPTGITTTTPSKAP